MSNVGLAQAFAMGLDIDPDHAALREGLQAVSEDLTGNDLRKVRLQQRASRTPRLALPAP